MLTGDRVLQPTARPTYAAAAEEHARFRARVLNANQLCGLDEGQWQQLSSRALVENPFYARGYVLAGIETIDAAVGLQAYEVRKPDGELIGLFPMSRRWGVAIGARNRYQFSTTPLVHRDHAEAAIRAWLGAIKAGQLPSAWYLQDIDLNGAFAGVVRELAGAYRLEVQSALNYSRPHLSRAYDSFNEHLAAVLPKARRKELERALRRLREQGNLAFEHATDPDLVEGRVEDFLRLEKSGWKGKAGTAFLCKPATEAFARAAFRTSLSSKFASTDTLLLDGTAIAVSINIASGTTLFTPKCSYDEGYRRWSPGLVLEYLILEHFYGAGTPTAIDSAATVDGHVVTELWGQSKPHGELFVGKPAPVRATMAVTSARRRAKHSVKSGLTRLKHLLKPSGEPDGRSSALPPRGR